jgi:hypothetical protein
MTPQAALVELLHRLGARYGAAVYIISDELIGWAAETVAAMKSGRLLVKARAASGIVCPGCEQRCPMPVEVHPAEDSRTARTFIVCNKPEDSGRIAVELGTLEQWQINGGTLAGAVARLLGLNKQSPKADTTGKHWTLGLLTGKELKAEATLAVNEGVALSVAGHSLPVADIITFDGDGLTADKVELLRLVDTPAGAPRNEPSTARREARKLDTHALYKNWRKAYRALKQQRRNMSDVWCSQQIAKQDSAAGRSANTIQKRMKQPINIVPAIRRMLEAAHEVKRRALSARCVPHHFG